MNWALVGACVLAGALAPPLHAVATPVSAVVAGLIALLGLYVWRWSRLPLFRLVLLSLIAGLAARLMRAPSQMPVPAAFWVANVVSALVFAAAHLPSWSAAGSQGPWLAMSVLAFNSAGALVFGYVFATRGIVPAMLTHAGADCAIQLIGPLTG